VAQSRGPVDGIFPAPSPRGPGTEPKPAKESGSGMELVIRRLALSDVEVRYGERLRAFVRAVRDDGKVDLGFEPAGYARVAPLAERILAELERVGGRLNLDDDSDPEAIRERFDVSKKAFKQALGALYRERRIAFLSPGIELVRGAGGRHR